LRIVFIGAIGIIKGFEVLLGCALHAKKMRLPLQFIVIGYGKDNDKLIRAGVQVHGRYPDNQASQLLKATKAHVAFLPSVWPETYSYVLSLALSARLPTFAFDIGAIASRLSMAGLSGGLIPLHDAFDPRRINERLLDYRNECIES
jgi:glycosyltransferase involved in cell wall biosynthesis